MEQYFSSTSMPTGNQGAPTLYANNGATNIYIMRSYAHIHTRAHDYRMLESIDKGK
jgi:hypothetical protein